MEFDSPQPHLKNFYQSFKLVCSPKEQSVKS